MKNCTYLLIMIMVIAMFPVINHAQEKEDPFLWLEDIQGDKAMQWVKAQNEKTLSALKKHPEFEEIKNEVLKIFNSEDRIASPSIRGNYIYNFWQDETHERGIWRRTTFKQYLSGSPQWETVLDIDSLCKAEDEKWAYRGASFLYPDYERCMLNLSRGGSDAVVIREFDLKKKKFIEDGFYLPEAKGSVSWIDENTLLISTNFGEGTITQSGYPRMVKVWKRGTNLNQAKLLYEGKKEDMGVWGYVDNSPERQYQVIRRSISFYTAQVFVREKGEFIQLDIPEDSNFGGFFKNQLLVQLKSDWNIGNRTYPQGALISIDYDRFLQGERDFTIILKPDARSSITSFRTTENYLLLNMLNNVRSNLVQYTLKKGAWKRENINVPDYGTIRIGSTDEFSDRYFFTYTNFLNPSTLYFVPESKQKIQKVKSLPHFFDGSKFTVQQFEVASKDGTKIPYFVVAPEDMQKDGTNPTLLYAYGGFEVPMLPRYSAIIGTAWLAKGGVYVVANIRGGGEFGPRWHQAGLKENRQRVYDDFFTVSEDLVEKKITSPDHLGIMGGSNGGLLVGVAYTQRPDLYNAVVCSVPLLDMKRYNKLLAGASWMAEYGNPDIPEQWEYIKNYSPYQNLKESKDYPRVFFNTTTRDDRVHPGHARKMAAKMAAQGHPFFYFENTEGGHGSGVTHEQQALMTALEYVYLHKMLK
ncbi:MAG: prolyl oligopeptidase family serine peptidase [bacterium]